MKASLFILQIVLLFAVYHQEIEAATINKRNVNFNIAGELEKREEASVTEDENVSSVTEDENVSSVTEGENFDSGNPDEGENSSTIRDEGPSEVCVGVDEYDWCAEYIGDTSLGEGWLCGIMGYVCQETCPSWCGYSWGDYSSDGEGSSDGSDFSGSEFDSDEFSQFSEGSQSGGYSTFDNPGSLLSSGSSNHTSSSHSNDDDSGASSQSNDDASNASSQSNDDASYTKKK